MKILLVEDRDDDLDAITAILGHAGHEVTSQKSAEDALSLPAEVVRSFDFAVLDWQLPRMDGLQLGQELVRLNPRLILIMLSAHGTMERKVEAHYSGFIYFIDKPGGPALLELITLKASEVQERQERLHKLDSATFGIIGECPEIISIKELISIVAPTDASVLILGESGTGKELVASAIYTGSLRRGAGFKKINCAAIPGTLLESELFGHEKGAFTGAHRQRIGNLEEASGGTVFLDEIAEMDSTLQAKLLRVLEDGSFTRVGGNQTQRLDIRVVSATNRKVPEAIRDGKLREDLFYREHPETPTYAD